MVNRREMLAGALAGAAGAGLPGSAAGAQDDARVESLLKDIRDLLEAGLTPQYGPDLAQLRLAQHSHHRATGSFPRFIDVGNDVWDHAYDWHVANRRPVEITRVGDRYQMQFLYTTLVLRPDATGSYIGSPTDVRQP